MLSKKASRGSDRKSGRHPFRELIKDFMPERHHKKQVAHRHAFARATGHGADPAGFDRDGDGALTHHVPAGTARGRMQLRCRVPEGETAIANFSDVE